MLRASKRVLKPGGRTAFFVVMIQPGLSPERYAAARAAAPAFLDTEEPYLKLLEAAGFGEVVERDVTEAYRRTAASWLRHASELEAGLRDALGDRVFEEKREIRRESLLLIEDGLEARRFYSARA